MPRPVFDKLWTDVRLATMVPDKDPWGRVEHAALAVRDGRIAFAGPTADLPGRPDTLARTHHRCNGAWLTPGLIDPHTHLVFAGDRAAEWEARLAGASYEDLARAGGGIASTVRATRAADAPELTALAEPRLRRLIEDGATTVEIKSGYGLDLATELRCLQVARDLAHRTGVRVKTSLLAAHSVPPEYADRRDAYLDLVCNTIIPQARPLADAADAFCESITFTPEEVARVFTAARAHGLPVKLHADQLSNSGGAALAARFGALSADHLEHTDADGVAALARSGTVATLLPGAFYVLRETRHPPVAALRAAGVPIALGTDLNPGTSPLTSPLLAMHLAVTLLGLTPAEAFAGMTRNAARALGLAHETGMLAPGLSADLALWDVEHPAEIIYWLGSRPLGRSWRAGQPLWR